MKKKSTTVCEICGIKGKLRGDLPWILTLCNKHYSMKLKEYRKKEVIHNDFKRRN